MRSATIKVRDIEIDAQYEYHPGSSERFSSSFGNWLPGESAYVELDSVKVGGAELIEYLSDKFLDEIEDTLLNKEIDEERYG